MHQGNIVNISILARIKQSIRADHSEAPFDLNARMAALAGCSNHGWRTSLIDFFHALGIDSSYAVRKELASELGLPQYQGTREENLRMLRSILQELARDGAILPHGLVG